MQQLTCLSDNPSIDRRHKDILSQARLCYGHPAQILVSNEELCELAAVCAKFPRYTDPDKARYELRSAAIDEVADVLIILDHVINIFGLTDKEIHNRIDGKIDRLVRWLSQSYSMEQTTVDRRVEPEPKPKVPCGRCKHFGDFRNMKPGHTCSRCVQNPYCMFEPRSEVSADGDDS